MDTLQTAICAYPNDRFAVALSPFHTYTQTHTHTRIHVHPSRSSCLLGDQVREEVVLLLSCTHASGFDARLGKRLRGRFTIITITIATHHHGALVAAHDTGKALFSVYDDFVAFFARRLNESVGGRKHTLPTTPR